MFLTSLLIVQWSHIAHDNAQEIRFTYPLYFLSKALFPCHVVPLLHPMCAINVHGDDVELKASWWTVQPLSCWEKAFSDKSNPTDPIWIRQKGWWSYTEETRGKNCCNTWLIGRRTNFQLDEGTHRLETLGGWAAGETSQGGADNHKGGKHTEARSEVSESQKTWENKTKQEVTKKEWTGRDIRRWRHSRPSSLDKKDGCTSMTAW